MHPSSISTCAGGATRNLESFDEIAAGNAASLMQYVKGGKALDDFTYAFTLSEPMGGFIDLLASHTYFYLVSPKVIETFGAAGLAAHPGGTGPFKVSDYKRNQQVVLTRNEGYWGILALPRPPHLPRHPDQRHASRSAQRRDRHRNGAAARFGRDGAQDPKLEVYLRGKPHNFSLLPNFREKPFSDAKVREAVSKAIDRDTIVKSILQGTARPGTQFYGIGNPGFDKWSRRCRTRATSRARSSFSPRPAIRRVSRRECCAPRPGSGVPSTDQIMEFLQSNLAEVEIKVKLELMEWNAYLAVFGKGIQSGENIGAFCMAMGTDTAYVLDMYGN